MQDTPRDHDEVRRATSMLPADFLGAVTVNDQGSAADSAPIVIGLLLELDVTSPLVSGDSITYSLQTHIFVGSPNISQTCDGTCVLNQVTREVRIRSESGSVSLIGALSPDRQSIEGTIDFCDIQVMDLHGSFLGQAIVLEADEDDD